MCNQTPVGVAANIGVLTELTGSRRPDSEKRKTLAIKMVEDLKKKKMQCRSA